MTVLLFAGIPPTVTGDKHEFRTKGGCGDHACKVGWFHALLTCDTVQVQCPTLCRNNDLITRAQAGEVSKDSRFSGTTVKMSSEKHPTDLPRIAACEIPEDDRGIVREGKASIGGKINGNDGSSKGDRWDHQTGRSVEYRRDKRRSREAGWELPLTHVRSGSGRMQPVWLGIR